jgi:putative heme-binding domain-containing protein
MAKLGGGRMPHIGSTEVDRDGVELIYQWLRQLPVEAAEQSASETVTKLRAEETAVLEQLRTAKESMEQIKLAEQLLSSTSGALLLLRAVDQKILSPTVASFIVEKASHHGEVTVRDLFERFLPVEKRTKRLGSVVQPDQILSLPGDPARGKQVFFETAGVSCKNCHRIAKEGKEVGPELTTIAKKYDRAQLLESLLEPSKRIDPQFVTYLAETKEGRQSLGLLVKKDAREIVLRDAQDQLIRIPVEQIEQFAPQQQSLMPDLLLRDLTAQQVADLLAYLHTLK